MMKAVTGSSRRDLTLVRRGVSANTALAFSCPLLFMVAVSFHCPVCIFSLSCLYLFIVLSVSFHCPFCIFSLSFLYLFIVLSVPSAALDAEQTRSRTAPRNHGRLPPLAMLFGDGSRPSCIDCIASWARTLTVAASRNHGRLPPLAMLFGDGSRPSCIDFIASWVRTLTVAASRNHGRVPPLASSLASSASPHPLRLSASPLRFASPLRLSASPLRLAPPLRLSAGLSAVLASPLRWPRFASPLASGFSKPQASGHHAVLSVRCRACHGSLEPSSCPAPSPISSYPAHLDDQPAFSPARPAHPDRDRNL